MVKFYHKTPVLNYTYWRKSGKITIRIHGIF